MIATSVDKLDLGGNYVISLLRAFYEPLEKQTASFSVEKTIQSLGEGLGAALHADHICLWIPNPTRGHFNLAFSTLPLDGNDSLLEPLAFDESRCGHAWLKKTATFYETLLTAPACLKRGLLEREGLHQMWCFPIFTLSESGEQVVSGVVTAHYRNSTTARELEPLLPFLGNRCGAALASSIWAEVDYLVQQVYRVTNFGEISLSDTLDRVAAKIAETLGFEACSLLLENALEGSLELIGTTGIDSSEPRAHWVYPRRHSLSGIVAATKQVFATENMDAEPEYDGPVFPDHTRSGRRQYLGAPVLSGDALLGVVRLRNKLQSWHCSPCLNHLDWIRAQRLGSAIAPLFSLVAESIRGREMMQRIRHDLKVPPLLIANTADYYSKRLAQGRPVDGPEMVQKLDDIVSFSEIMIVLANMSRLDEPLRPEFIYLLGESIAKLAKMLEPICRQRKLHGITVGSFAQIPKLWIDPVLFEIALYNLLTNAIKYSHSHTDIDIEAVRDETVRPMVFQIHIRNWGIGVEERDRERIFDPRYRGRAAIERDPSGIGLGLPIARNIIERHGGKLELTELTNPTRFTISLPSTLMNRRPQ